MKKVLILLILGLSTQISFAQSGGLSKVIKGMLEELSSMLDSVDAVTDSSDIQFAQGYIEKIKGKYDGEWESHFWLAYLNFEMIKFEKDSEKKKKGISKALKNLDRLDGLSRNNSDSYAYRALLYFNLEKIEEGKTKWDLEEKRVFYLKKAYEYDQGNAEYFYVKAKIMLEENENSSRVLKDKALLILKNGQAMYTSRKKKGAEVEFGRAETIELILFCKSH